MKATAGITAVPDHAAASGATAAVTPSVLVPANKGRKLISLYNLNKYIPLSLQKSPK